MATQQATNSLVTCGYLCELLQAGPGQIAAAVRAAGVKAPLTINGRHYYSESDIARIRARLPKVRSVT
jgi:hypothetical protein